MSPLLSVCGQESVAGPEAAANGFTVASTTSKKLGWPVGASLLGPDADKIMGLGRCAPEKSKTISTLPQIQ
jgi:hypothetical protein